MMPLSRQLESHMDLETGLDQRDDHPFCLHSVFGKRPGFQANLEALFDRLKKE
jgi:hypothetical protein